MRTKWAILIQIVCLLAAASPAQQDGQLSFGGTVTNSSTGEPIERALVEIVRYPPRQPGAPGRAATPPTPFVARTFTDASGGFRFTELAAGNYSVSAQKPQYSPDEESPVNTVALTASTLGVKLKLSPLAAITGKVLDQDGQPVWAASVVASSTTIVDGLRQTVNGRTVSTDERGIFRLWSLQPGRYFLKAAGRSGSSYSYVGDTTPQFFGDQGFAPAYYGGGGTLDTAAPLELRPGSETHADLTVQTEPAYAIRGALANYVPHRTVRFELLTAGESRPAGQVSINSNTGRFEIQGVIRGEYVLHASQDATSADIALNVAGADVGGVALTLLPGVDLKVLTLMANSDADADETPEGKVFAGRFRGALCTLNLRSADGRSSGADLLSVPTGEAEATIHGVIAGLYRAAASCFGAYAQSIMWGTQDLLANPFMNVPSGGQPPPIQVVAARGGGTITGKVTAETRGKPGSLSVLVVPQFGESTGPVEQRAWAGEEAPEAHFQFANLAPGSYLVYAFANGDTVEFRNPNFLQSLTGGLRVQVEDKAEKTIEITEVIR